MDNVTGSADANRPENRETQLSLDINSEASHSPLGGETQTNGDSKGECDYKNIFVAENEYVRLSDDGEVSGGEEQLELTAKNLGDAVNYREGCSANAGIPTCNPVDLELAIDQRLFSELEETQRRNSDNSRDGKATSLEDGNETKNIEATASGIEQQIQVDITDAASKMSTEQVEQIKSIMAGIQLSDNAIPPWARRIPENKWMPQRKNSA
ncbi:hypothetical protein H4R24_003469 [Coemansia sp. RSA 988]|nr:hypothetical protein H4R24_003469 [Coemansia sp. RSA 988]